MAVRYRLGVLLDETGEPQRAKPYLEAFVRVGAGAEAGLPPYLDAQQRLAKML